MEEHLSDLEDRVSGLENDIVLKADSVGFITIESVPPIAGVYEAT